MLFDLIFEVENLLKRRYKENAYTDNAQREVYNNQAVVFSYCMNQNIDILLNTHKQVAIRIFAETDDIISKNCIAVNVLHKRIDNVIDFNYDNIEKVENTQIVFRYEEAFDLFSNLNKILDFAEHLSSNILF
jgi:hypothetical protein